MAVWNTFNPGIVKKLFKDKKKKGNQQTWQSKTIEELVRLGACRSQRKQRSKVRSSLGFKSTSTSRFDKNTPTENNRRSMPDLHIHKEETGQL